MSIAKQIINRILSLTGYEIRKVNKIPAMPSDISASYLNIINAVSDYAMTSVERINALISAVDYVVDCNIEGDYIECGVWCGGSTMAAALQLLDRNNTDRQLYLYDTYEGMPAPTKFDFSLRSRSAQDKFNETKISENSSTWCFANLEDVQRTIGLTAYPIDKVTFVKGKVEDTIPAKVPEKIAILRLDTDWYASTKHEMEHLYPLLVKGGVLIIDDYGHWEGCRKAIDEYFLDNKVERPLTCPC